MRSCVTRSGDPRAVRRGTVEATPAPPWSHRHLVDQEIGMAQREVRGERGEMDGAAVLIAVGIVDQEAVRRVVDDAIVAILRTGADMKQAAWQHAAVAEALKDAIAKQDLVDVR